LIKLGAGYSILLRISAPASRKHGAEGGFELLHTANAPQKRKTTPKVFLPIPAATV
jgi:hypothetical protein